MPHWKFHINYVPCSTCGSLCEFECAEALAKMMMNVEHMKQSQAEMIKNLEEEVIHESVNKSGVNMELTRKLQAVIMKLDRGKNDDYLSEICSLAYLPGLAMPKLPHNPNRKAVEEWFIQTPSQNQDYPTVPPGIVQSKLK